jgi:tetratricopeptide (TPR) repeat protein
MPKRRTIVDDDAHTQLARAVQASGRSITWLARMLGYDRSTLHKWLNGTNAIPPSTLQRLCDLISMPDDQRIAQFVARGYAIRLPAPPVARVSPALHQLRAPTHDFVGREHEIEQIVALLAEAAGSMTTAICGVHGMGGVGKTELAYVVAQRLAAHFPDAQIVLALRGTGNTPMWPTQALQHVIRSFDPQAQLSEDLHELQARYCSYLHGKRVLVLADDAADAAQVRALLPPPGSGVIITSRQRFTLEGIRSFDLDMLPEGAAVALLHSICPRIGAAAPRLAALCCYLPLALRVGAGLLASDDSYAIEYYLTQLRAARLPYLCVPEATDDPQASIEASLALSYHALPAAAQQAMAYLGVFPASFDLRAAQAVMQVAHGDATARLGQLRHHHLIEWDAAQGRYQFHDLVREFALRHLADDTTARQRHAAYFLQLAEQNMTADHNDHGQWLATMEREHANVRAACVWLDQSQSYELLLRLSVALGPFWIARDYVDEGNDTLRVALANSPHNTCHVQAQALMYAGALARVRGDTHAAHERYQASRALWALLEDEEQYAEATFQLGLVATDAGEKLRARTLFAESLTLFERSNRYDRAGVMHANLGRIAVDAGDYEEAQQHFETSYDALSRSDDAVERAWLLLNMARLARVLQHHDRALLHADEALVCFQQHDYRQGIAWAQLRRGMIFSEMQHYDDADAVLEQSLALFGRLGNNLGCAMAHRVLAEIALIQRNTFAMRQHATYGLKLYHMLKNKPGMSLCLVLLAWLHLDPQPMHAAILIQVAESLLQGTGMILHNTEFHAYTQIITAVHARLDAFQDSLAHLPEQIALEQALAIALA